MSDIWHYMTAGCGNHCKCEMVARHPDHNHVTTGALGQLEIQGLIVQQHCDFEQLLNEWSLNGDYLYIFLPVLLRAVQISGFKGHM